MLFCIFHLIYAYSSNIYPEPFLSPENIESSIDFTDHGIITFLSRGPAIFHCAVKRKRVTSS